MSFIEEMVEREIDKIDELKEVLFLLKIAKEYNISRNL